MRPGIEVFEAPHLVLLHTVLVYHRALTSTGWAPRVLIVRLSRIPFLDRRGAHALTVLSELCRGRGTRLLLSDVRPAAWCGLARQGTLDEVGPRNVFAQWTEALERARELLGGEPG
jgi:sulfate permease, SulP family